MNPEPEEVEVQVHPVERPSCVGKVGITEGGVVWPGAGWGAERQRALRQG